MEEFCTGTQEYIETYVEQGWLKSIDEVMNDFGAEDALAAEKRTALLDLTKQEALYVLPCDQSIEGIWYNTELFEQYDLEVPETMDDFMEVCETLLENDVQPMVCPGKEKWPITRLIGSYATMAGGVDALVDANNGDLSWGDDVFLQAYSWLAEMGEKGYFGQGVTTVDTNTANSLFLSGKAAMYYNGSWFTSNLNSEENQIDENVGMFAFPTVDGGKGEANTFTTSYGMYWCFNSGAYDDAEGEWMAYLLKNYGDVAMELQGRLTAYTLSSEPEVDYYTNVVLEAQEKQTGSGVWPEYAMVTSVQDAEYSNAQMLILNQITPEAYGEAMDAAMSSAQ
ncbi:ABC transporter substrate-binding protein [Schaedlerella arabinosiphila]|uniref:ABC transporter substrate-binding protein n=1 Tax=Schaedlerella arabinosiphila TaxID=2044587 RepID=UPI002557DF3E|nr:extracellular solute-binding protein [Schaedlerella arabinosiphila]